MRTRCCACANHGLNTNLESRIRRHDQRSPEGIAEPYGYGDTRKSFSLFFGFVPDVTAMVSIRF
jgi:hypothetical protein